MRGEKRAAGCPGVLSWLNIARVWHRRGQRGEASALAGRDPAVGLDTHLVAHLNLRLFRRVHHAETPVVEADDDLPPLAGCRSILDDLRGGTGLHLYAAARNAGDEFRRARIGLLRISAKFICD